MSIAITTTLVAECEASDFYMELEYAYQKNGFLAECRKHAKETGHVVKITETTVKYIQY